MIRTKLSLLSFALIAGGKDDRRNYMNHFLYETILEYDITGDSIREIGTLREGQAWHAVSVVKPADFSKWWWCP